MNYPFDTLVMEEVIPLDFQHFGSLGYDPKNMERMIQDCKNKFADEVMRHIYVDAQNLTNKDNWVKRSVKFVLRVQSVK